MFPALVRRIPAPQRPSLSFRQGDYDVSSRQRGGTGPAAAKLGALLRFAGRRASVGPGLLDPANRAAIVSRDPAKKARDADRLRPLDPDTKQDGLCVGDDVMKPADFKRWRKSLGLSQKAAAEALGLKRRVLQYYEKGERDGKRIKIPKTVRLACYAVMLEVDDYAGPPKDKPKPKKKLEAAKEQRPSGTPANDARGSKTASNAAKAAPVEAKTKPSASAKKTDPDTVKPKAAE
jgi:transcriptional regulator with XRE-family HTH domain